MSQSEDTPELGITEEDRRKMGELLEDAKSRGQRQKIAHSGVDGGGLTLALEVCPDAFTPVKLLVATWLFENGSQTASEVSEATGVSKVAAKDALDDLVDAELAHTNSSRTFEGPGRKPTVYVPAPEGLPASA